MNPKKIQFKKKVKVIQLFRNLVVYGKERKSFDKRKENLEWRTEASSNGYVKEGELFLNEDILDNKDIKQCAFILLIDGFEQKKVVVFSSSFKCFSTAKSWVFYIFRLKENLDLELNYEHFEIGMPHRDNFKLASLLKNKSLEIKINGKIDFSLTAGRPRTFIDQVYILEHLGEFDQAVIMKNPVIGFQKQIPEERKLIDLVKPLW